MQLLDPANHSLGFQVLVPIKEHGHKNPLFMLPGIGGSLVDFYPLAQGLADDQPAYGLQPIGLDGVAPPQETLEIIAATYYEELRKVQPHGPYQLMGYSLGGIIAYELAQQILKSGEQVGSLMMIDSSFEDLQEKPAIQRIWFHLKYMFSGQAVKARSYFWTRLKNFLYRFKFGFKERPVEYMLDCMQLAPSSRRIAAVHWQAWRNYKPEPFNGKLNLLLADWSQHFETSEQKNLWPWEYLALQGAQTNAIPGVHENLFKGENLRQLATIVQQILLENTATERPAPVSASTTLQNALPELVRN